MSIYLAIYIIVAIVYGYFCYGKPPKDQPIFTRQAIPGLQFTSGLYGVIFADVLVVSVLSNSISASNCRENEQGKSSRFVPRRCAYVAQYLFVRRGLRVGTEVDT